MSTNTTGSPPTLPIGYGTLAGDVGPGPPPGGAIPNMVLTFTDGTSSFHTTVTGGKYLIDLPAGTWNVRSPAGVCAVGISVSAGGWQRDDLGYPMAQCQNLSSG